MIHFNVKHNFLIVLQVDYNFEIFLLNVNSEIIREHHKSAPLVPV